LLYKTQDPCISIGEPAGTYPPFDDVVGKDVWVNKADGVTPVKGEVWPDDPVYFPDYSNSETRQWWIDQIVAFKKVLDFDSLWIGMNGILLVLSRILFPIKKNDDEKGPPLLQLGLQCNKM